MYERFTDRARKVMQLANQEAQRFNHEYIGTEHVLLGLVAEGQGVAAFVLKGFGIDLPKLRSEVKKVCRDLTEDDIERMCDLWKERPAAPPAAEREAFKDRMKQVLKYLAPRQRSIHGPHAGTIAERPLVPRAKRVIDHALEEARLLGHHYVGTEHLLLGLLPDQETVAVNILLNLGLKLEDVRREVLSVLGRQ